MDMELNICHMYPDLLNLYSDTGNIITLQKRCQWRNIRVNIFNFTINNPCDLNTADIILLGGGSDREQGIMFKHLINYREQLKDLIEGGTTVLAICGGYQLLGRAYYDAAGKEILGLGIFDFYTRNEGERLIGNIVIKNNLGLNPASIVGFENHGGRTYHNYQCLGSIIKGWGNNGKDKGEGIVYKNCIGTYMHGPLLPKNPHLADYILLKALQRKYKIDGLQRLDDSLELEAHYHARKL